MCRSDRLALVLALAGFATAQAQTTVTVVTRIENGLGIAAGPWTQVGADVPSAGSGTTSILLTGALAPDARRYYRVRVKP